VIFRRLHINADTHVCECIEEQEKPAAAENVVQTVKDRGHLLIEKMSFYSTMFFRDSSDDLQSSPRSPTRRRMD